MVTYFNSKDMTSFGEYLLSEEREKTIKEQYEQEISEGRERPPFGEIVNQVHHSDFENWKKLNKKF